MKSQLNLDCGDSSCLFALTRGGMRTNHGCRCLEGLPIKVSREIVWFWRAVTEEIQQIEAELAALKGEKP